MICCVAPFGCASTETAESVDSEPQSAKVTKALYEAIRDDPISTYSTSKPWPDDYMPASESYEECAFSAIPLRDISEDLMLKGLQVCESRYPSELDQ